MHRALDLRTVDELAALPPFASVRELLQPGIARGRCEVLPAIAERASHWSPGSIGPKGGDFEPPWWEPDPIVPCGAVHLFRLRDAFYFPEYGVVVSADGEVMQRSMDEAAWVTPDLAALPYVAKYADESRLNLGAAPVERLARAVVTVPWGAVHNYGHFILDSLSAAVLCRDHVEGGTFPSALDDFPRVFPPLRSWQRRHLELIEVEPLELTEPVYRVEDLVFTSCMAHFIRTPNLNYRSLREQQLARHVATGSAPARIYVSRGDRRHRQFLSEARLQARLRDRGFAVVVPEEHTVDQQIEMFHRAEVIVGCAGAALSNVLYARPGATVVEIKSPQAEGRWVGWICALIGCKWRPYYSADQRPPEGESPWPNSSAFDVDLDDLMRFVESCL